jgi:hypothetical protein
MSESELSTSKSTTFTGVLDWLSGLLERESWMKMTPAILCVALIFSEIQWSTSNIMGVDGYFHIKIAEIMRQNVIPAPIYFPWLQLTILNPAQFTDHHLLFHILLEPFTLLDLRLGAKLAAASFASIAVLVVYGLMYWQRVRWSFLWLLLLLGVSGAFLYRLSMTRRQAIVLILFVALIVVAFSRRDRLALLTGFVFSWVYDGFLLFMIVAAFLMLGRWVDDGVYRRTLRWLSSAVRGEIKFSGRGAVGGWVRRSSPHLSLLGFATAGVILGLIVNPYTPRSLTFAIEHALPKLVPTGDFIVGVGTEWYPYERSALLRAAGASLAAVALGFIPLIATLRYERRWDGRVVALALLATFFTVLLLRSRRFVEYQPAFAVLFCAFAWSFQIPSVLRERIRARVPGSVQAGLWALAWVLLLAGAVVLLRPTIDSAQNSARASRAADTFAGVGRWLEANTPAESRVFTTDWDDFPVLFYQNTHNTYLIGLDPTYMYQYQPDLYLTWRAITRGQIEQPSSLIRDTFGSKIVLTDRDHYSFHEVAAADPGMRIVYRDATAIIFAID